jgi:hypothetical protein
MACLPAVVIVDVPTATLNLNTSVTFLTLCWVYSARAGAGARLHCCAGACCCPTRAREQVDYLPEVI